MGKKMKLPFLSKNTQAVRSSSWAWPSCHQPRTLSFRTTTTTDHNMLKTINSAYLDATIDNNIAAESWFTNSSESASSFSTATSDDHHQYYLGPKSTETVIRGLRSERLFFEPGETSSILDQEAINKGLVFKESVVLSMESQDPYVDFRKSMEEMVEAHGLEEWEGLEELLCCYLRVNGKSNHGYIVSAFVDLLVGLALASSSSSTTTTAIAANNTSCSCSHDSPFSPVSFYASSSSFSDDSSSTTTTHCVSSLEADQEEIIAHNTPLSSLLEAEDEIKDKDDDNVSS